MNPLRYIPVLLPSNVTCQDCARTCAGDVFRSDPPRNLNLNPQGMDVLVDEVVVIRGRLQIKVSINQHTRHSSHSPPPRASLANRGHCLRQHRTRANTPRRICHSSMHPCCYGRSTRRAHCEASRPHELSAHLSPAGRTSDGMNVLMNNRRDAGIGRLRGQWW